MTFCLNKIPVILYWLNNVSTSVIIICDGSLKRLTNYSLGRITVINVLLKQTGIFSYFLYKLLYCHLWLLPDLLQFKYNIRFQTLISLNKNVRPQCCKVHLHVMAIRRWGFRASIDRLSTDFLEVQALSLILCCTSSCYNLALRYEMVIMF